MIGSRRFGHYFFPPRQASLVAQPTSSQLSGRVRRVRRASATFVDFYVNSVISVQIQNTSAIRHLSSTQTRPRRPLARGIRRAIAHHGRRGSTHCNSFRDQHRDKKPQVFSFPFPFLRTPYFARGITNHRHGTAFRDTSTASFKSTLSGPTHACTLQQKVEFYSNSRRKCELQTPHSFFFSFPFPLLNNKSRTALPPVGPEAGPTKTIPRLWSQIIVEKKR